MQRYFLLVMVGLGFASLGPTYGEIWFNGMGTQTLRVEKQAARVFDFSKNVYGTPGEMAVRGMKIFRVADVTIKSSTAKGNKFVPPPAAAPATAPAAAPASDTASAPITIPADAPASASASASASVSVPAAAPVPAPASPATASSGTSLYTQVRNKVQFTQALQAGRKRIYVAGTIGDLRDLVIPRGVTLCGGNCDRPQADSTSVPNGVLTGPKDILRLKGDNTLRNLTVLSTNTAAWSKAVRLDPSVKNAGNIVLENVRIRGRVYFYQKVAGANATYRIDKLQIVTKNGAGGDLRFPPTVIPDPDDLDYRALRHVSAPTKTEFLPMGALVTIASVGSRSKITLKHLSLLGNLADSYVPMLLLFGPHGWGKAPSGKIDLGGLQIGTHAHFVSYVGSSARVNRFHAPLVMVTGGNGLAQEIHLDSIVMPVVSDLVTSPDTSFTKGKTKNAANRPALELLYAVVGSVTWRSTTPMHVWTPYWGLPAASPLLLFARRSRISSVYTSGKVEVTSQPVPSGTMHTAFTYPTLFSLRSTNIKGAYFSFSDLNVDCSFTESECKESPIVDIISGDTTGLNVHVGTLTYRATGFQILRTGVDTHLLEGPPYPVHIDKLVGDGADAPRTSPDGPHACANVMQDVPKVSPIPYCPSP